MQTFQLSGVCQSNVHGIFSIRFIVKFACNSLLIILLMCCFSARERLCKLQVDWELFETAEKDRHCNTWVLGEQYRTISRGFPVTSKADCCQTPSMRPEKLPENARNAAKIPRVPWKILRLEYLLLPQTVKVISEYFKAFYLMLAIYRRLLRQKIQ